MLLPSLPPAFIFSHLPTLFSFNSLFNGAKKWQQEKDRWEDCCQSLYLFSLYPRPSYFVGQKTEGLELQTSPRFLPPEWPDCQSPANLRGHCWETDYTRGYSLTGKGCKESHTWFMNASLPQKCPDPQPVRESWKNTYNHVLMGGVHSVNYWHLESEISLVNELMAFRMQSSY